MGHLASCSVLVRVPIKLLLSAPVPVGNTAGDEARILSQLSADLKNVTGCLYPDTNV